MAVIVQEEDKTTFDWDVTKRLVTYLAPNKTKIYWAMAASLLTAGASVAGPPIIGWAVDEGVQKRDLMLVALGVIAYMVIQGIGALGFRWQIMLMAVAGQSAIQKIRDDLFQHLQRLSMAFFAKYETGRLISRIINDVNTLREAITWAHSATYYRSLVLSLR